VKSVAGRKTLAYLSHGKEMGGQIEMVFEYELVIAMTEEGQSEALMEAARSAGATGGTVVPIMDATASGEPATAKSVGKAMLYLVVKSEQKAAVMKAVREKAGTGTSEGTICFSLPVSSVAGLTDPETKEW
jgi:nitrogen regulatory protein PII